MLVTLLGKNTGSNLVLHGVPLTTVIYLLSCSYGLKYIGVSTGQFRTCITEHRAFSET